MQRAEKYPIGIQTFASIREEGYTYVDKTDLIYELANTSRYVFLSRPRRFGKSLLLSTLEAYFEGRKELFEGLAVSQLEKEWKSYPVLRFNFSAVSGDDWKELDTYIRRTIIEYAKKYDLEIQEKDDAIGLLFGIFIKSLSEKTGKKVVILVDEYDKSLNAVLQDAEKLDLNSSKLQPFFAQLKDQDPYIRFAMITGVARFRHLTLFSGANNLEDISMDPAYATLCGITLEELEVNFPEGLSRLAAKHYTSQEWMLQVLKQKYDGYRFTSAEKHLFNPFSTLNVMKSGELNNFWLATGTSKVFFNYLQHSHFDIMEINDLWVIPDELIDIFSIDNPIPLLYQTGYLTIKRPEDGGYILCIPNGEVRSALVEQLVPKYMGVAETDVKRIMYRLKAPLLSGDVNAFMGLLQSLLAKIPYELYSHEIGKYEATFHLLVYQIFLILGVDCQSEISISGGRIDLVAKTPAWIYVMEFKMDKPASEALRQINEKDYALPYQTDTQHNLCKIGISFSSAKRNITAWEVEK